MKTILLLLCSAFMLYANQESKIVLITYSNQDLALQSLKKFIVSHRALFKHTPALKPVDIGVFQSQQYYFVALKPFATRGAAQQVLEKIQADYASAYISSYPNSANRLIMSQPLIANDNNDSKKPTKTALPVVLEKEFLKPLSIEEIIQTTSSRNNTMTPKTMTPKETEAVQLKQPIQAEQNTQSLLYVSYGVCLLFLGAIVMLIWKNHRLKGQINYKQALLNRHTIAQHDIPKKQISIDPVDLAHYVKSALNQAIKEEADLLASKPVQQVQTCMNDIVTIDSFLHGEVYIKNRTFTLQYIAEEIAKRYQLTLNIASDVPHAFIGSVETIEHIFLRLSYTNIAALTVESLSQSDESLLLEFTLAYDGIENHTVDHAIIKQFVLSVGGTVTPNLESYDTRPISAFTLPFLHAEDNSVKIKRP